MAKRGVVVRRAAIGRSQDFGGGPWIVRIGNENSFGQLLPNRPGVGNEFFSEKDAITAGKRWLAKVIAARPTIEGRRAARESYYFEVEEISRDY